MCHIYRYVYVGCNINTLNYYIPHSENVWQWESFRELLLCQTLASQILAFQWYPYGQNLSIDQNFSKYF